MAPILLYFIFTGLALGHLVVHLLIVFPFVTVTLYGGYWVERSTLSTHRWTRISRWLLGITLIFLALNGGMMTLWGNGVLYNLMWGLFAASIGSAAGMGIGILEARTIEQERVAERQRIRQEAASRRSKQFEEFAKILSHDLRNPLNVAWGYLELVREDRDSAHLAALKDSLHRMDEIIDDVLTLTWSGQEINSEDQELLRLGEVARTAWGHVDAGEAHFRIEDNPPVCANDRRLQRLLENLFRNAIEHGGTNVTVWLGACSDGFFVEDSGPGIPPKRREKVFEAGHSTDKEGTGLGLSIVRTIAETHGWEVSVSDGREGGARFEFSGVNKKHRNGHPRPPQRAPDSVRSELGPDHETPPKTK